MIELAPQIQGDGRTFEVNITRAAGDVVDWSTATVVLRVGIQRPDRRDWLTTLQPQSIDAAESAIAATFELPGSTTETLTVPRTGLDMVVDATVTPFGGEPSTLQGRYKLLVAVPNARVVYLSGLASTLAYGEAQVIA